jgi:hypothetical protein
MSDELEVLIIELLYIYKIDTQAPGPISRQNWDAPTRVSSDAYLHLGPWQVSTQTAGGEYNSVQTVQQRNHTIVHLVLCSCIYIFTSDTADLPEGTN